jgi:ketosteroid isomerase-like protein
MKPIDPVAFTTEWLAAWNAHDVDRVLRHYTDDFTMSSPFIERFTGEPSGTLVGKAAVGAYWHGALTKVPDLKFEHIVTCAGVRSLAIHYRGPSPSMARHVVEVVFFDADGLVERAAAHYG